MSKELQALNEIREKYIYTNDNGLYRRLTIIEDALKEYEKIKDIRITARFDLDQVNKEHKALEFIKEKNVCIHDLKKSKTLKEYNGCREWEEELTQEEYKLLKEVLYEKEI